MFWGVRLFSLSQKDDAFYYSSGKRNFIALFMFPPLHPSKEAFFSPGHGIMTMTGSTR